MSSSNIFKRKIYSRMLEWKKRDGATALLIEGARRIGKSTIGNQRDGSFGLLFVLLYDFLRSTPIAP